MFEVVLALCLLGAPDKCTEHRYAGGETLADCRDRADDLVRAATDEPQSWPCVPAGEQAGLALTRIAEGIFVHKGRHAEANRENGGDLANIGVIIGADSVAVIDAGGSAAIAKSVLTAIRAETTLPVRWLILTHMHPDHTLGASVFSDAGATVVGHPALPAALASRFQFYSDAQQRLVGGATPVPVPVVSAPSEIDLGNRILELAAHTTGHTDNDLTVFDRVSKTLFLGDLVFSGHAPAVDGSILGWIGVLDGLVDLSAARAVPGHGPVAMPWPGAAEETRAYLDALVSAVRDQIAKGVTMLEAMDHVQPIDDGRWLLLEAFHKRNVSVAFSELEWE